MVAQATVARAGCHQTQVFTLAEDVAVFIEDSPPTCLSAPPSVALPRQPQPPTEILLPDHVSRTKLGGQSGEILGDPARGAIAASQTTDPTAAPIA